MLVFNTFKIFIFDYEIRVSMIVLINYYSDLEGQHNMVKILCYYPMPVYMKCRLVAVLYLPTDLKNNNRFGLAFGALITSLNMLWIERNGFSGKERILTRVHVFRLYFPDFSSFLIVLLVFSVCFYLLVDESNIWSVIFGWLQYFFPYKWWWQL